MRLVDRILGHARGGAGAGSDLERLKREVHRHLVADLEGEPVGALGPEARVARVREVLARRAAAEELPLNRLERAQMVEELLDEVVGLGPLEPLMRDDGVQDILVNGHDRVFVERGGRLYATATRFRDAAHLRQVIDRIVAAVGRRVDEASPMVDARLPDGSRVNVVIPPLALDGPTLSVRKFGVRPLTADDLDRSGTWPAPVRRFLAAAVRSRLNLLVSGGTGSGKTTLLNVLSAFVPEEERVVTVEDSAELRLQQPHVVPLEARPPNVEGRGEVTLRDLVRNSLRMRPDRILVGEVRGAEVLDMLQAMNTGHPGSMSTVHANSPRDALARIEVMASFGAGALSERALRLLVTSAIDLVVQTSRLADGSRRVVGICEVSKGAEGEVAFHELLRFEQEGIGSDGRVRGAFVGVAEPRRISERLRAHGHVLHEGDFRFRQVLGQQVA